MESSAIGIGRLDCYEDMFKEITRKLYGDDPDHRSKFGFIDIMTFKVNKSVFEYRF